VFGKIPKPYDDFNLELSPQDGLVDSSALVTSSHKLGLMTLTAKDKQILTNTAEGIIHVVAPEKVQMEIIDVTHLYKSNQLDKIRSLYFEETDDNRHRED
jgi:hypothetical protein